MAVFHLKYRPRKISELDSEDVRKALKSILNKKDIPQSFLFAGPKGSGKTSAARILAKAVNCENPTDGDPCGECETCKLIERGSVTDVIEMDAASNRGIDEVRGLRDQAYLLPVKLKKKVFIIDEVHMMTKEAFNAMLKLVEEPPAHTIFVMCTTDPQKIPETVLSRLVRVDFKKGKKDEVIKSIERSAKAEGIEIDQKSMELIFQKSEGSFRNVQRLLMELSLELGNQIKFEDTQSSQVLSKGGYDPVELEEDLASGKIDKIIMQLEKLADKGVDFGELRRDLIAFFQERLIACFSDQGEKGVLTVNQLTRLLNLLIGAGKLEKDAVVDQLPLELAFIDFGSGSTTPMINQTKVEPKNEPVIKAEDKKQEEKKESQSIVEMETLSVSVTANPEEKEDETEESSMTLSQEEVMIESSSDFVPITMEEVEKNWGVLLQKIKPLNLSVEALLRSARPAKVEKDRIFIEVYYPFHKDKLEEDKNRRLIEDRFKEIFNSHFKLECALAKTKQKPIEIKNNTVLTEAGEQKGDVKIGEKEMYDIAKEIFG